MYINGDGIAAGNARVQQNIIDYDNSYYINDFAKKGKNKCFIPKFIEVSPPLAVFESINSFFFRIFFFIIELQNN